MHDISCNPRIQEKKAHQELCMQSTYLEEISTLFHMHLFAVFAACIHSTAAATLSYSTMLFMCANVI